jgi:hypothetical protein
MDNEPLAPPMEVGRIVFCSWEHEWKTGQKEAASIALAERVMPAGLTKPIYDILEQWERDLLRSSLPFPPYGLRVRRATFLDLISQDGSVHLVKLAHRSLQISELCSEWDQARPQPSEKRGKYGEILRAPTGNEQINSFYEIAWRPVASTEPVDLDNLLREFSPRHETPKPF